MVSGMSSNYNVFFIEIRIIEKIKLVSLSKNNEK